MCVLNAVIKNSIHVAILLNKSINQEEEEKCKPYNRNWLGFIISDRSGSFWPL